MIIYTDSNNKIVQRIYPAINTEHLYEGGITIDDSISCDGTHYKDGVFYTPALTIEEVTTLVVSQRNSFLAQSDWTQLPDVPLATKGAWATYRQALRDITTQAGFPYSINWPTKP